MLNLLAFKTVEFVSIILNNIMLDYFGYEWIIL